MKRDRQRARETARPRPRGLVLRAVRLALRIPCGIMAEACAVPAATLSSYELGRRAMPDHVAVTAHLALVRFLRDALEAAVLAEDSGTTRPAPRLRRAA